MTKQHRPPSAGGAIGTAEDAFRKGVEFNRRGNLAEAERLYRAALSADAAHSGALLHLGLIRFQQARPEEAIGLMRDAIRHDPGMIVAHGSLATVLLTLGRHEEARESLETALRLDPNYVDAHLNFAALLRRLGRREEAFEHYRKAQALAPKHPLVARNLAGALVEAGEYDSAAKEYGKAISLTPNDPKLHYSRAAALMDAGRAQDAVQALTRAVSLSPATPLYRWQRCMAQLPILYRSTDEIEACRNAFSQELRQLAEHVETLDRAGLVSEAESIGQTRPFYLAYQGCHDRELQAIYGGLVRKLMAALLPRFAAPVSRRRSASGSAIRVGILSGFFRDHSNWRLPIQGWVENLPRERFQLFAYHTGATVDDTTARAREFVSRFVQGPLATTEWCDVIRGDDLDLLIVPETAMDPMTIALAGLRLAPVQVTSWGHPITSGLPTMDYFLSSALMEPPGAEQDYTEKLVGLPNLGVWFSELPAEAPLDRQSLGLASEDVIYWSCQSLYKYLPQHDRLFADIAVEVPRARFLFIRNPSDFVTAVFQERLKIAFRKKGLDSERYCRFLGRLDRRQFAAVTAAADVFLDNPGWSGCNSTLEAIACGLPTVTSTGELMRMRHTAALLQRMGLTDFVAATTDELVQKAIRLGSDAEHRAETRQRIVASRHALYRDAATIEGLANFIERAVG